MKKAICWLSALFALTLCFGITACAGKKLSAPTDFQVNGRTISWSEVEGASGYTVSFGEGEQETDTPSVVVPEEVGYGEHQIEVFARGDGRTYADSEKASFSFTVDQPVEHGFDKDGFEYTLMEDGKGYEVSMGRTTFENRIKIPAYFKWLPVKKIANMGFIWHVGNEMPNRQTGEHCNTETTSIILPETLEEIGSYAFAYTNNLTAIKIPDSVTKLGASAFYSCRNLARVTFSKNLKVISKRCFEDCSLSELSLPDGLEEIEASAFAYSFPASTDIVHSQNFAEISIPNSVKRIEDFAFDGCWQLRKIKMPNALEEMGGYVFRDTAWLNAQSDGYVTLGNVLYQYKGEMEAGTVIDDFPSDIKYIASMAFSDQRNLVGITLPDGVKLIGGSIFSHCENLERVRLPSDLTEIPDSTFSNCYKLLQIQIPDGVRTIGYSAFSNCQSLEEVIMPDGLTEIANRTFFHSLIIRLVVPVTVKKIGFGAIRAMLTTETKIYYAGTKEQWEDVVVDEDNEVSAENVYFFSEEQPQSEGNYWHYVDGVPTVY